jgi:hypothetical protein
MERAGQAVLHRAKHAYRPDVVRACMVGDGRDDLSRPVANYKS